MMGLKVVTEVMRGSQCGYQALPLAVYEVECIETKSAPLANNVNAISYPHVTIQ